MLEALIFDFDGVIVDSEPIHMAGFQRLLRDRYGIDLSREEYYQRYLALTDADGFRLALGKRGLASDPAIIEELIAAKSVMVRRHLTTGLTALPGVVELMRAARDAGAVVGVCSGALREEIELALGAIGVRPLVQVIVSANDVVTGKPDPTGYRLAREGVAKLLGRDVPARDCVAVEDAPGGIAAARGAGLRVLAVTNSMDAADLTGADRVVTSLANVSITELRELVR